LVFLIHTILLIFFVCSTIEKSLIPLMCACTYLYIIYIYI